MAIMNPVVLAFVGDAVHTLLVRTKLVDMCDSKTGELHKRASREVNAKSQSAIADRIIELLTEEESAIYRRARNAHINTLPKNATQSDYHKATGFEAVIGYLYLTGQHDRINTLLMEEL